MIKLFNNGSFKMAQARKRDGGSGNLAEKKVEVWKQFEENRITHSAAHHLLAVRALRKERGYARVTDVARYLNITTGSASTNLKALKRKQLIREDENRFLVLTEEGEALAKAVLQRKKVLYKFLTEVLRVRKEQAEIDSCKTEHLISMETAHKLGRFLDGYLKGRNGNKRNSRKR
ncbi:MAG: metal-dependent transcriptional regulator [Candidatus Dadabacteria bacterium]|nr:MAG: metal-dependent transcriptional regulator [Candidatus Dadabacteria bacterium]